MWIVAVILVAWTNPGLADGVDEAGGDVAAPTVDAPATRAGEDAQHVDDAQHAVEEDADAQEERDEARRAVVVVAIWVVCGLILIGVVMVLGVMMYSGRTRRIAREEMPVQSRPDDFETLQRPAPEAGASAASSSVPDSESDSDSASRSDPESPT